MPFVFLAIFLSVILSSSFLVCSSFSVVIFHAFGIILTLSVSYSFYLYVIHCWPAFNFIYSSFCLRPFSLSSLFSIYCLITLLLYLFIYSYLLFCVCRSLSVHHCLFLVFAPLRITIFSALSLYLQPSIYLPQSTSSYLLASMSVVFFLYICLFLSCLGYSSSNLSPLFYLFICSHLFLYLTPPPPISLPLCPSFSVCALLTVFLFLYASPNHYLICFYLFICIHLSLYLTPPPPISYLCLHPPINSSLSVLVLIALYFTSLYAN